MKNKIKMKNILKLGLLSLALGATMTSCTKDFLDVNDDPNSPTISTPDLTLPVAQQYFAEINSQEMNYLGNEFMYNWTTPSNWSANQTILEYTVTTTFFATIFETSYGDIFKNLAYVKNYEDASGAVDYSAYDAIAETIRGFQYQYLVDLYGDVPFSEANQRAENLTPKYDDAETVYKATIDSLTAAAKLALDLPENAVNPGDQDIMFGGEMTRWAQFANTIKLRMLVRLSNTGQDSYITDQIASIDANGAGYITADVNVNPGYSDDDDKQNPFYEYNGFQTSGTELDRHDFTVATDYIIEYLESTTNDPRLSRLYTPSEADGTFKGVYQNINLPGEGFTSADLSKVGDGLLKSADQDQPIMMLSEALFIQAEAAQRGYTGGNAQELYESAITASFVYLGVDDGDDATTVEDEAAAYYGQSIANVSWGASDPIEAIITQKWVALNGTSGIEPWIEYTRTGFPSALPTSQSSDGQRPVSLIYPASEYSRNANNVPARTPADAFTNNPFWK